MYPQTRSLRVKQSMWSFFFFPESFETSTSWRCRKIPLWFPGSVCMHICVLHTYLYMYLYIWFPPVQVSPLIYIYIYIHMYVYYIQTTYRQHPRKYPRLEELTMETVSLHTEVRREMFPKEVSKLGLQFSEQKTGCPKFHQKSNGTLPTDP